MEEKNAATHSQLDTSLHPATPPPFDGRVEQVIAWLRANLKRDYDWERFTWEQVAGRFDLSLRQLERRCKAATQQTPSRYLHHLRLEQACELLATTYLSAKQIAARLGFKHENYFSREFKRVYGLTPIAYREQCETEKWATKKRDVAVVQGMSL